MAETGKVSEVGEREGVSERVDVGVLPPERSRERVVLFADSVAVDEARAGLRVLLLLVLATGVDGAFG